MRRGTTRFLPFRPLPQPAGHWSARTAAGRPGVAGTPTGRPTPRARREPPSRRRSGANPRSRPRKSCCAAQAPGALVRHRWASGRRRLVMGAGHGRGGRGGGGVPVPAVRKVVARVGAVSHMDDDRVQIVHGARGGALLWLRRVRRGFGCRERGCRRGGGDGYSAGRRAPTVKSTFEGTGWNPDPRSRPQRQHLYQGGWFKVELRQAFKIRRGHHQSTPPRRVERGQCPCGRWHRSARTENNGL